MKNYSNIFTAILVFFSIQVFAQSKVVIKQAAMETILPASTANIYTLIEQNGMIKIENQVDFSSIQVTEGSECFDITKVLPETHVYVLHDALFFGNAIIAEVRGIGKSDQPETLYAVMIAMDGIMDVTYGVNGILNISDQIQSINEDGFVYSVCPMMFTDNDYIYLDKGNTLQRCNELFNTDNNFGISGRIELLTKYGSAPLDLRFAENHILCRGESLANGEFEYNTLDKQGRLLASLTLQKK